MAALDVLYFSQNPPHFRQVASVLVHVSPQDAPMRFGFLFFYNFAAIPASDRSKFALFSMALDILSVYRGFASFVRASNGSEAAFLLMRRQRFVIHLARTSTTGVLARRGFDKLE
jgi:hypothetical protein